MQSVGTILAEVFAQRGVGRSMPHGGQHNFPKESPLIDALRSIAPPLEPEGGSTATTTESGSQNTEIQRISEIFRANGETLDNRLSITLRRSRSKAALVDPERADARFEC